MFSGEGEALDYINENNALLLTELKETEIRTIYSSENIKINVMRYGKKILTSVNRYGNRELTDILKEMIDTFSVPKY